jgi:hypothetical protein
MHYLERLAQNPHYQMSPKQLARLEEYRRQSKRETEEFADTNIPIHSPTFDKQETLKDKKNHERTRRNPLPNTIEHQG